MRWLKLQKTHKQKQNNKKHCFYEKRTSDLQNPNFLESTRELSLQGTKVWQAPLRRDETQKLLSLKEHRRMRWAPYRWLRISQLKLKNFKSQMWNGRGRWEQEGGHFGIARSPRNRQVHNHSKAFPWASTECSERWGSGRTEHPFGSTGVCAAQVMGCCWWLAPSPPASPCPSFPTLWLQGHCLPETEGC